MHLSSIPAHLWLSAALVAPVTLAGCSTATYGTGEMPEMAMFREMTGGFLDKSEKRPIEYQPRAPLVMPPAAGQAALPAPVETAGEASPDWPSDPMDSFASADARATDDDLQNDVNQDEYRRLKPLTGVFSAARRPTKTYDDREEYYSSIVHGNRERQAFGAALADAKGFTRTERRYLTDPPLTYRDPEPTAPVGEAAAEAGEDGKKGNFLTRWWRRK